MEPGGSLDKKVSVKERGGSVMVIGREDGCCCFGC
jgi:hypothetical protein